MSVAVFTAKDMNDLEYMGFIVQEGPIEVKVYLGHADNVKANVEQIIEALNSTMEEMLKSAPPAALKKKKLIVAQGPINNGVRKS